MKNIYEGNLDAKDLKVAVVVSRFNSFITDRLVEGAVDCLVRHGANKDNISLIKVPGAFEIPIAVKQATKIKDVNSIIALGAVIRGSTPHFDYVAAESAKGLAKVALDTDKPVAFGILTCDTIEQAIERAGTKAGNKGADAAMTVIEMYNLLKVML